MSDAKFCRERLLSAFSLQLISRETGAMNPKERLLKQLEVWGIRLEASQVDRLLRYAHLLSSYRQANVIGTRDLSLIVSDHLLDSLSCFLLGPIREATSLIDVGSGGGLPGLPLKLIKPGLKLCLLEATGKKAKFLDHAIEELGLNLASVVNARAEECGHLAGYRGQYQVATVRAVASLPVILEYCVPLVQQGGFVVALKGGMQDSEIREGKEAAQMLGAKITEIAPVEFLPEISSKYRQLVVIQKITDTPANYPRRPGRPKKRPLGKH